MRLRKNRSKNLQIVLTLSGIYDFAKKPPSMTTNIGSDDSENRNKKETEDPKQSRLGYTIILRTLPYRTCLGDHLLG